jgi:hypothetical protein
MFFLIAKDSFILFVKMYILKFYYKIELYKTFCYYCFFFFISSVWKSSVILITCYHKYFCYVFCHVYGFIVNSFS